MNKRLQTILETVENLMEYRVPSDQDRNKRHERLRQMPGSRVSSPSTQPLGSIEPNPNYSPRGDKIDPHYVSRTEYDSRLVVRRPPPKKNTPSTYGQRPSTEAPTGLLGAGSSVSGYDSRPKTGGLLGAGSSVSGYDSGSDAPTPQPPSNKPPYPRLPPSRRPDIRPGDYRPKIDGYGYLPSFPRLPPSRRPGSPDNPFSKIPGGYDGFGKPKSPKGDDNYGPFQGKDTWRDRDEWVVDKEIQTYPPKYVYRRKTDADRIGDRFGSINRFRSIM